jgi:hypothetical protein
VNINHSEKMEKKRFLATEYLQKKCGDKEAPVATFVKSAFLDTADLDNFTSKENYLHV